MRTLPVGCAVALLLGARAARATRPYDGNRADVAQPGELKLQLGASIDHTEAKGNYWNSPALSLNFGVVPRLEVQLHTTFNDLFGLQSTPDEQERRIIDNSLVVKWLYREGALQKQSGLSLAAQAGVLAPNAGDGSGWGAETELMESCRWPALDLHFTTQLEYTRSHELSLFQSAIVEGPSAWPVRPAGEVFAEHVFPLDSGKSASTTYSLLVGVIWKPAKELALDAAFRIAHEDGGLTYEIRAGFTWSIPGLL
jgi:hypothetical protein